MKEYKLTYNQLRDILGLVLANGTLRARLEDFLAGKLVQVSELELLDLIRQSEVDKDLIRILTGKEPETMDAVSGVGAIIDFFAYIRANSGTLQTWLGALGYAAESKVTPTKGSK